MTNQDQKRPGGDPGAQPPAGRPAIECGILVAGVLEEADRRSLRQAVARVGTRLASWHPELRFKLPIARLPESVRGGRVAIGSLVRLAAQEGRSRRWDLSIAVTAAELVGTGDGFCSAGLSRPLQAAAISLLPIDPATNPDSGTAEPDADQPEADLSDRLAQLMLHAITHLGGLTIAQDRGNHRSPIERVEDLDRSRTLDPEQIAKLDQSWREIADARLEEAGGVRMSRLRFAAAAIWINRRPLRAAVLAARPWQFPRRLSGLTLAAVSTAVILLLTAEAWDLGLSQSAGSLAMLWGVAMTLTTAEVVWRQRLFLRRSRSISELTVLTNASAIAIVAAGLLVTWLTLLILSLAISGSMHPGDLIQSWASSSIGDQPVGLGTHVQMATFVASVGLMIGGLGASFESQDYFQSVIFIDEEVG